MKLSVSKDIEEVRAMVRASVEGTFATRQERIASRASMIRVIKASEADRLLDGKVKTSALLKREAKMRGMTERQLAEDVRARSQKMLADLGESETERQMAQDELASATTIAELEALREKYS